MIRSIPLLLVAAALAAAGACSKSAPDKAPLGTSVELANAGAEPRAKLRFAPSKGDSQTIEMTLWMTLKMGTPTMPGPTQRLAPTTVVMKVDVVDVTDSGDFKYEVTIPGANIIDDGTVDPMIMRNARAGLGGIDQFKGWAILDKRGFVKDHDFSAPPGAHPQVEQLMGSLQQALEQLTMRFPKESVGVGAQWSVQQTLGKQGLTIEQTSDYEITSIEAGVVKANVKVEQTGDKQEFPAPPGTPPSRAAQLLEHKMTSAGSTVVDLAKGIPTNALIDGRVEMTVELDSSGQAQQMSTDMATSIALKERATP